MSRTSVSNARFGPLFAALLAVFLPHSQLFGQQTVSLDSCYVWAQHNYPLVRRAELIAQTEAFTLENIAKGWLPQVTFNGQATIQSAVTALPITLPGVTLKPLSKDQYKMWVDVSQTLYDGGTMHAQQQVQRTSAALDSAALQKDLFLLKERVHQLYFGALLLREQEKQVDLLTEQLRQTQQRVEGAVAGGTAYKSDLALLKAEILTQNQRKAEMEAGIAAYLQVLSAFVNHSITDIAQLVVPAMPGTASAFNRPEMQLFALQRQLLERQMATLNTAKMPRLSAFAQGGYGRPALNMLDNTFTFYGIAGVRLNWNISALYNLRTDQALLQTRQRQIAVDSAVFRFNNQLALTQQTAEYQKFTTLLKDDAEIIRLREEVLAATKAKYDNGVITMNDYLREMDAVSRARLNESLHRMQALANQYNQLITNGN